MTGNWRILSYMHYIYIDYIVLSANFIQIIKGTVPRAKYAKISQIFFSDFTYQILPLFDSIDSILDVFLVEGLHVDVHLGKVSPHK